MKSQLSVLAISTLLLTGCAAESKYEYDEVDLMIYEKCIEQALGNSERIRPQFYIFQPYQLDAAKETCKDLLPNIKS
jgi:hypothetical protein